MYLQQHWTTGKHSWTGRRCIGVATISAAERNRMSAGALRALAAGGSGHPQDCTACGSRATTAPASAALAATARPLPGATFSPSHICAMPRCGPEGHTVLMSGSRARTRRSNRSLPILAQIGSPRTHQRCPLLAVIRTEYARCGPFRL